MVLLGFAVFTCSANHTVNDINDTNVVSSALTTGDNPNQIAPPLPSSRRDLNIAQRSTAGNADGSFTFTQVINQNSQAPFYTKPAHGGGFGIYSKGNQSFGWMHTFDLFNGDGISITKATLTVHAWDVDSEPFHGKNGEYDQVSVDGKVLNPGFLQGKNNEWSKTTFDIPLTAIMDDGKIHVALDIDIYKKGWLTTVNKSVLTIEYLHVPGNLPPYKPKLKASNDGLASVDTPIKVTVVGPNPPDPNEGDTVNYSYRWFVDIGQGHYIDAAFAGLGVFTGAEIPASVLKVGQKWRVQVLPRDQHRFMGPYAVIDWQPVSKNLPPVANAGDDIIAEQTSHAGAKVSLSAAKSYDPENDPISYFWSWNGGSSAQKDFSATFPAGTTEVTLTVTEIATGKTATDTVNVTVQDTIAPTFRIVRTHYWWLFDDRYRQVAKVIANDAGSIPKMEVQATQKIVDTGKIKPVPAKIQNGSLYIQFTRGYYIRRIFTATLNVKDDAGNAVQKEFIFKTFP